MQLNRLRTYKPALGKRIFKTALAIFAALITAELLGAPSPAIAGVVAIFCVQQTAYRSYQTFIERTVANLSGAIIAVIFGLLFGGGALVTSFACLITLSILVTLKKESHIPITLVIIIFILDAPTEAFVYDAITRFITIMIGVTVSFLINVFFLPPKHEGRLLDSVNDLASRVISRTRLIYSCEGKDPDFTREDKDKITRELIDIEASYELYMDERKFYKKTRSINKSRRLIIYRQMIRTLKLSVEALKRYHMYRSDFLNTPEPFQKLVLEQFEILGRHHELIINKDPEEVSDDHVFEKMSLTTSVRMLAQSKGEFQFEDDLVKMHMLSLVASIYNYAEAIEHLQNLLYCSSHFHNETVDDLN